jgi:mono/diheme cytochrome c family protein
MPLPFAEFIFFLSFNRDCTYNSKTKTMRSFPFSKATLVLAVFSGVVIACNSGSDSATTETRNDASATPADPISHGKYLTVVASCNDCHSPKIMTPQGPMPDSSRILSGHPANSSLPPLAKSDWIQMSPDITAFAGPWGISFAANLTSDSATGIGAWSEETFIKTLRTGKHLGNPNGRDILPPMPWPFIGQMTDDDLKAIYAYLQSLPPINNKVPQPVAPPDMAKYMAK